MGQYYNVEQRYKYINIDKRIIVCANYGLELCKHSWLGNNSVVIPIKQLVKTEWQGDRVIQLGDCVDGMAASTELREEHLKFIKKIKKEVGMTNDQSLYWDNVADEGETFKKYTLKELFDSYDLKLEYDAEYMPVTFNEKGQKCSCDQFRYLYNTKRKEYVDSFKILPSYVDIYKSEILFTKLDAYSLLVAIGNGLGGGDYNGPDNDMIGLWATTSNSIVISSLGPKEVLDDVSEYTEITPMFSNDYDCEKQAYVVKNEVLALSDYFNDAANDINVCDYHIDFEGVFQQRQVNLCFEKIKEKYENDKGKRTA